MTKIFVLQNIMVKHDMNMALSFDTNISKKPNFLCSFKEKSNKTNDVPKRIRAKIHIENPTLTKILVKR
jgi:hypothetical protein